MRRGARLGWVLFLLPSFVLAHENDTLRSKYVHKFSEYFYVGPLIKKRDLNFDIFSTDDRENIYNFKANNSFSIGFAVNLFDVNLEAAFAVPVAIENEQLYGDSDVSELQLTAMGKSWFADAYHQRYSGFYVTTPQVAVPKGQPYPQRGDLTTKNYGISFAYIFNHDRFSLRSSYIFTERQKVSKGSFVVGGVLSTFSMNADSALVPASRRSGWGEGADVDELRFTTLGFGPGYSYNFVRNKFFFNITLILGPAHYWVRYANESTVKNDLSISFYSGGRVGIGFNGDKYFGGITLSSQGRNVTYERTTLENSATVFRLVAGIRLLEKGFMKKSAFDIVQGK